MKTIDYEIMRAKLELVFQLLQRIAREMRSENESLHEIQNELSRVGSIAVGLIFTHRHEGTFQFSESEEVNARAFGEVVFDHFMDLQKKIAHECSGLPVTLSISRNHILVKDGINSLIELLKTLMEKEVRNG